MRLPAALTFLLAALLVAVAYLVPRLAWAHDAPSGWSYSTTCCSTIDCAPYHGEVRAVDGGWFIVARNEIVPYASPKLKVSGDEEFHLCQYQAGAIKGKLICLYAPAQTF